jgi:outer membrane autotransporter protein
MVGLYSNHEMTDDWSISTQAGWTRIVTDSRRNLDFGGINRTATAGYINNTLGADIELAKGFDLGDVQGNSWRIEPYGMLGILWSDNDGFTETGAGSANLSRAADSELTGTAGLGFRLAGMIVAGDGKTLIPQFRLGWDHHVGPVSSSSTLAFSGTPSFTVSGGEVDRNTLRGNMGFALADDDGWSIYADYQPSVSENAHEHAFGAGFRMKF